MTQDGITRRASLMGFAGGFLPLKPEGFKGAPGAAGNAAASLAQLKAAPVINGAMLWSGVPFAWETAGAPYTADEDQPFVTTVESNHAPLSSGAWVRQSAFDLQAAAIAFKTRAEAGAARLPDHVTTITIERHDAGCRINPALYREVENTGPLQPWQFQSNGSMRRWSLFLPVVSPSQLGARYDGSDESSALQSCLNYAGQLNGGGNQLGGTVQLESGQLCCRNVAVPDWVSIRGISSTFRSNNPCCLLNLSTTGEYILRPAGTKVAGVMFGVSFDGFALVGRGNTQTRGADLTANHSDFRNLAASNLGLEAFTSDNSAEANVANVFTNIYSENAFRYRGISSIRYNFDIGGTDHTFCGQIEISGGLGNAPSGDIYRNAIRLRGSAHKGGEGMVGEFGCVGIRIDATNVQMTGLRADHNQRQGFILDAATGSLQNLIASNNSLYESGVRGDPAKGFDAIRIDSDNKPLHVDAYVVQSVPQRLRYGFYASNTNLNRTRFSGGCVSIGHAIATFYQPKNGTASHSWAQNGYATLTGATPSFDNITCALLTNGRPTTVIDFVHGVNGQAIDIVFDGNTTIQNNGSTIATKSGANLVGPGSARFVKFGDVWREM